LNKWKIENGKWKIDVQKALGFLIEMRPALHFNQIAKGFFIICRFI